MIALALSGGAAASDEAPSLELLLHLAEFADADGRPVDPQGVAEAMEVTQAGKPETVPATDAEDPASRDAATPQPRGRDTRPRKDHDED